MPLWAFVSSREPVQKIRLMKSLKMLKRRTAARASHLCLSNYLMEEKNQPNCK